MTTLAEIETAADALSASEQQELLLHITARLKAQSGRSAADYHSHSHQFDSLSHEFVVDWMAEDEAAMRRIRPSL